MTITRYDPLVHSVSAVALCGIKPDGQYVKYEDHVAEVERLRARVADLERWQTEMVEKVAEQRLDGYRELAARAAAAENAADTLRARIAELNAEVEALRRLLKTHCRCGLTNAAGDGCECCNPDLAIELEQP